MRACTGRARRRRPTKKMKELNPGPIAKAMNGNYARFVWEGERGGRMPQARARKLERSPSFAGSFCRGDDGLADEIRASARRFAGGPDGSNHRSVTSKTSGVCLNMARNAGIRATQTGERASEIFQQMLDDRPTKQPDDAQAPTLVPHPDTTAASCSFPSRPDMNKSDPHLPLD